MTKRNAGDVKRVDLELDVVVLKDGEHIPITNRMGIHGDEVTDPQHIVTVVAGPSESGHWFASTVDLEDHI